MLIAQARDLSGTEKMLALLSISELPQLLNVLKGEMSLVGPRPEPFDRVKRYSDWQRQRLSCKPGVTGLAQVHGLREENSSEDKAYYDLRYIQDCSLLADLSLVVQTIWTISRRLASSCAGDVCNWLTQQYKIQQSLSSWHMLIVRSPVRISFGGGGTDLPAYFENYGGAVLSTAINKYFYTIVGKRSDGHVQIISSDLRVFETWKDISGMSIKDSGSALEIPLAVLEGTGLRSVSRSIPGVRNSSGYRAWFFCQCLCERAAGYVLLPASSACPKYDLAEKAFHIASDVLGKPVGKQDEFAAAFGGLNFITFHKDGSTNVEPLRLEPAVTTALQQKLMLFFTGAAHHSWSILKEQEASSKKEVWCGG